MHCPFCKTLDTKVIDSRHVAESNTIRRRRECTICSARFTTFETADLDLPAVVKRDKTREQFDLRKIKKGLEKSVEKRPIERETLDNILNHILQKVQTQGEREIESQWLGELVMTALKKIDQVAYIRFASVYRSFEDVQEFCQTVEQLAKESN